jgi:outer membrane protein assembly factor BamB
MRHILTLTLVLATAHAAEPAAQQLLDASGVKGGLIVHLGCGDGKLTAALRANYSFIVHGLDTDAKNVEAARKHIQSLGLYGRVSADQFDGKRLPYTDNLVNLIVTSGECRVPKEELLRVLAPNGVVITRHALRITLRKPRPADIDEWGHYLHDASGNPVAQDRRVGPPRQLQWVSAPRWCRSHEVDISIAVVVTAGGRIFSIQDEAPTGVHDTPLPVNERRFPDKWALVAQDAFNGVSLWKRPIPNWGSRVWEAGRIPFLAIPKEEMWALPPTVTRRVVAVGDRVYMTMGYRAPVSELDAATGKTLREFADTATTDEIVVCDGILLARVGTIPDGPRPQPPAAAAKGKGKGKRAAAVAAPASRFPEASVVAIDLSSGKTLWKQPAGRMIPLTLAAANGSVCFLSGEELRALDLRTGRERWKAAVNPRPGNDAQMGQTLLMARDKVLFAADGVNAHALADGTFLWRMATAVGGSFRGLPDVMVANGLVWAGTLTNVGLNLATGEEARTIDAGGLFTAGHHPRCYRSKATEDYLIWSKRGVEFMDIVNGKNHSGNDWCRTVCRSGFVPANGMLYVPPTPCRCQPGVQMTGFNAMVAAASMEPGASSTERLERGPAFGATANCQSAIGDSDWPTYRRDNARSGSAATRLSASLSQAWTAQLPGRITPPVVADGSLYVAGKDSHAVYRLDAASGKRRWSFTAGGPVDSPPTIAAGRAIFGCTDGWVYCLDASDGRLAWRFRAAPREKLIVSYGHLESAWPVHGSVLVKDNVAYVAAGRSSFLDGGIYLYGLDIASGKPLCQQHLDGPWEVPAKDRHAHAMEGTSSDILVCSGDRLYMLQYAFDLKLNKLDEPMLSDSGIRKTDRRLLATGGMLDDSGFDRLYWMYSDRWPGAQFAVRAANQGQLLAFDSATTYAVKYFNTVFSRSPHFTAGKEGYDLVADDKASESNDGTEDRIRMFLRQKPPRWQQKVPVRARAMLVAGEHLVLAGPPDVVPASDPFGSFEGRLGALLWTVSTKDGCKVSEIKLPSPPVFDGMAAARGKLFLSTTDGRVTCFANQK